MHALFDPLGYTFYSESHDTKYKKYGLLGQTVGLGNKCFNIFTTFNVNIM